MPESLVELDWAEYIDHNPYAYAPNPKWEHLEHDNTHCMRGRFCPTYDPKHGTTMAIGAYIGSDSEGIYPRHEWAPVFYFPSAPHLVMCENCADLIETTPSISRVDTVFSGPAADADWFIDIELDGFHAWIGYFSPDHGLDHEIELGTFDTMGEAHAAVNRWGADRNAELDRYEAEIDEALANSD